METLLMFSEYNKNKSCTHLTDLQNEVGNIKTGQFDFKIIEKNYFKMIKIIILLMPNEKLFSHMQYKNLLV